MKKKLTFLFILLITFLMFNQFTYATDINPDTLTNTYNNIANTNSTTSADIANQANSNYNSTANNVSNTTKTSTNTTPSTANTPTVTTSSSLPEADLGLSNILNIILIVIGVLLFFLGIAILIRLK